MQVVVVYNPLGWERSDFIRVPVSANTPVKYVSSIFKRLFAIYLFIHETISIFLILIGGDVDEPHRFLYVWYTSFLNIFNIYKFIFLLSFSGQL